MNDWKTFWRHHINVLLDGRGYSFAIKVKRFEPPPPHLRFNLWPEFRGFVLVFSARTNYDSRRGNGKGDVELSRSIPHIAYGDSAAMGLNLVLPSNIVVKGGCGLLLLSEKAGTQ
jgi:hypothetical protein